MKNSRVVFQEIVDKITLRENSDEIRSIAFILMDHLFGVSKTDILAGKMIYVTPDHYSTLENYLARLNASEPVQYVIGEAYFYGRRFLVDRSVLIPRPETEILVRAVLAWTDSASGPPEKPIRILDIGTGSGCLPVTLRLELPVSEVYATDFSPAALEVARKNAAMHLADVTFFESDILTEPIPVADLDVIVSNPPYVTKAEIIKMQENVLRYEPHSALFVPDDDPLLFYRTILLRAKEILSPRALVAMEINEKFGNEVAGLFTQNEFKEVSIIRDIDGKPRVVRGVKGVPR
jgi:release factor glutamine methyltransferase